MKRHVKEGGPRSCALIYVRVSRLDREDRLRQLESGPDAKLRALSPTTQVEQVKALPALRGMRVEVFEDLHRSGKNTQRPGLERLRERMRDKDVAAVAVWSMSRLGRSVPDLYELLEEISDAGVAFVSAKESIDTSTASGRAFVGVLAVLAQFERELTSERISANWEQHASSGKLVGPVPFGYRRVDGEVTIDEPAAELVRLIFRQYATGRYSYRALADWLNENGHRPPNADGRHSNGRAHAEIFVTDALKDILRNTRYAGRVVYRPRKNRDATPIIGQFTAIVDDATWRATAAMRAQNAAHHGLHYARTARYALTGLLRCQRCGSTVHGSIRTKREGRTYSYYSCRRRAGSSACDQPVARVEQLEEQMHDWLAAIQLPPGFGDEFARAIAEGQRSKSKAGTSLEARRNTAQNRLGRLRDLYELGDITRAEYATRRDKLQGELRELEQAAVPSPVAAAGDQIRTLVDDWSRMDAAAKRQVLDTIFTEVQLEDGQLVSATPRAGWITYLENALAPTGKRVGDARGWWESNPRRPP